MKKLLCFVLLWIFLPVSVLAYNGDMTVYITKTGECYHEEGCRHLRRSCFAISLEDAVNSGYRPCHNCWPPELIGSPGDSSEAVPSASSDSGSISTSDLSSVSDYSNYYDEYQETLNKLNSLEKIHQGTVREAEIYHDQLEEQQEELDSYESKFWNMVIVLVLFAGLECFLMLKKRNRDLAAKQRQYERSLAEAESRYKNEMEQVRVEAEVLHQSELDQIRAEYQKKLQEEVAQQVYYAQYNGKSIRKLADVPPYVDFDTEGLPHIMTGDTDEWTVYLAGKGGCYHMKTCRSVRKTCLPRNLYEAVSMGYSPCSQCKPPVLPDCIEKYRKIDQIRKRYHIDMLP